MSAYLLWGGTGQAKVLRDALDLLGHELLVVFDNRHIPSPFSDTPLLTGQDSFSRWKNEHDRETIYAAVAIGGGHGETRWQIQQWLKSCGHPPLTVVHPTAYIAQSANVAPGCQVLAMSVVSASAHLGDAVIVNTAASVDHDCHIGNGVHIAPGARLAGEIVVGDFAFIGTGATVLPRIHIGHRAIVGAGAVVTRDVPAHATVIGNPARLAPTRQSS